MLTVREKLKKAYKKLAVILQRKPMVSFLSALAILLLAIVASKLIFTPKIQPEKKINLIKGVNIYQLGSVPKLVFRGQIEKTGVIKLLSQTSGVVQNINVTEGQRVVKGTNLMNLSTNYQGADAAGVQTAIAARQYRQVTETFDTQKDLITKQRDLANKVRDNSSNLAAISSQSHDDTQSLINLNQNILDSLSTNLNNLQNDNPGGVNDKTILQVKEVMSQFQSGQVQLRAALRNLDYSTNSGNPPLALADLQKDIAQKQLDLQEKSLEMNRDITKLQLTLAYISASFSHPTAPVSGVVERVFVRPLQLVNPGTPLLTLVGSNKDLQLVVQLSKDEAKKLSQIEPATVHFPAKQEELLPNFVSTEATDGQLFSVVFNLPENDYDFAIDGDFIQVDLPLGNGASLGNYFVPLDAVIQTQDQSIIYILDKDTVAARKVVLGTVSGQFVEVTSGLTGDEKVILNRNVLEGDSVKAS